MSLANNLSILSALLLVLVVADARPSASEVDKEGVMTDALKYLEELDKYYAQAARPRQRRVGETMASALEKLSRIKNYYNEAGRPRFGKRSGDLAGGYPLEFFYPGQERWRK